MKIRFARHCDDFWEWLCAIVQFRNRRHFVRIGPKRRRPEGSNFLEWRSKNPAKEIPK